MMAHTVIKLEKVSKSVGETMLLENVHLHIESAERMGVVGANGTGKTTLLNIITGKDQPDNGTVRRGKHTSYLLSQTRCEVDEVSSNQMTDDFLLISKRLGLSEALFHRKATAFAKDLSGGERTKIALALAFSSHAELLVLDEPTNHLDGEGIEWLISAVRKYPGTLLAVSHDRFFLDEVVTQIVEVRNQQVQVYRGNYSFYAADRDMQRRAQVQAYESKRREQARIEEKIQQLQEWAVKSHREAGKQGTLSERRQLGYKQYHRAKAKKLAQRVKSHINRLEKLRDDVEKPEREQQVHFRIGAGTPHGNTLLEARRLSQQYGERMLFQDSNFYVKQGERIGVYGPNGCGKTTLLKMICQELSPSAGELWLSPSMRVAYLSQTDEAPGADTIEQRARELPHAARSALMTTLANMNLTDGHMQTPIARLSMGERMRLRLAELISQGHNILLMDEPTNHLDIVSREELESALRTYEGTIILVTHDRRLMEHVCDTLLVFQDAHIQRVDTALGPYLMTQSTSVVTSKEELMVVETRIAKVMGDICNSLPGTERYASLDLELGALIAERNKLRSSRRP
ncbi:ABC-F type ribosomal protection protein [Alicyclobacillus curvatus]|jgi:macrolide transport system ATP-binding/permease protein|nr:ABC-F type ribosomal protection protein [Alicyclobacillus curvatus]